MRSADVRVPGSVPAGRGLLAGALIALAGCEPGTVEPPPGDVDTGSLGVNCRGIDTSLGIDTPFEGAFGTPMTDTICPRRDEDWWRVVTTQPNRIIQAEATYEKFGPMRLELEWYGPAGTCVFPGACGPGSPCPTRQACDADRDQCRPNPPHLCVGTTGCAGGTQCSTVRSRLASVLEPDVSGSLSRAAGVFNAITAGEYIVRIFDHNAQEADDTVEYRLMLTETAQPDVNELNDGANLATPITSDTPVTGYLATLGDVDWYRIAYSGASPPILTVDLSWPAGAESEPTWVATIDPEVGNADDFPSLAVVDDNSSGSLRRVRRTRVVQRNGFCGGGPACEPHATSSACGGATGCTWYTGFYIRVSNAGDRADILSPYTLRVTTAEDPNEGVNRNDTAATATVVAMSSPGTIPAGYTGTIVATNDRDWLRLNHTNAAGTNSLAYFRIQGPPNNSTTPYLLQATLYETCTAGSSGCGSDCIDSTTCLRSEPFYQLPNPDAETQAADPMLGGRTPNLLETQVPVRGGGNKTLYLRIAHISGTPRQMPGYSDATYTVAFAHKVEPDAVEAGSNYDSHWIARPLRRPGADKGDFYRSHRAIAYDGGGYTPGASGLYGFVMLAAGTAVTPADGVACTDVTLEAFDDRGSAASGATSVTVAVDAGGLKPSCADAAAPATSLSVAINGASGTVGYVHPTGARTATLTTTISGSATIPFALPVYAAAPAPAAIRLSGARSASAGGFTGTITATLPAAVSGGVRLMVDQIAGPGAEVACAIASNSFTDCPNVTPSTPGACQPDASVGPPCDLVLSAADTTYDFNIAPATTQLVVFRVSGPSLVPATWVVAPFDGAEYFDVGTLTTSGYISYAGDNDFFTLALPPMGRFGLTVHLTYSGRVDVRLSASRHDDPVDFCDQCLGFGVSVAGSSCGPCTQPGSGGCGYVFRNPSGDLNIWVNDDGHDNWDENTPYSFDVQMVEGCPSGCTPYDCSQQ